MNIKVVAFTVSEKSSYILKTGHGIKGICKNYIDQPLQHVVQCSTSPVSNNKQWCDKSPITILFLSYTNHKLNSREHSNTYLLEEIENNI